MTSAGGIPRESSKGTVVRGHLSAARVVASGKGDDARGCARHSAVASGRTVLLKSTNSCESVSWSLHQFAFSVSSFLTRPSEFASLPHSPNSRREICLPPLPARAVLVEVEQMASGREGLL